jgi:hypothetical protein
LDPGGSLGRLREEWNRVPKQNPDHDETRRKSKACYFFHSYFHSKEMVPIKWTPQKKADMMLRIIKARKDTLKAPETGETHG